MTHGSLFSGIGGFDLASEWMGWENIFHCEWMPFPRKVLDYYWPNADSHIDICKTDFTKYANKIDILTGGFPCQPFSLAGKRKGTDDERYLWHEMLRAIQEIKPKYVIAENVFGITNIDGGLVFEQVCLDLEAEGYEVQPFIIPAASKNAPHRRDRVWFVATHTSNDGYKNGCEKTKRKVTSSEQRRVQQFEGMGAQWNVTDTDCKRYDKQYDSKISNKKEQFSRINITRNRKRSFKHSDSIGQEWRMHPVESKITIGEQFSKSNSRNNKTTQWENFPSQPPLCFGDDGLSYRLDSITFSKWKNESIKAAGNAIVPQIAYELFLVVDKLDKIL